MWTITSHSPLNISETLVPKDQSINRGIKRSRDRSRHLTPKGQVVTPIRLEFNVAKTAGERVFSSAVRSGHSWSPTMQREMLVFLYQNSTRRRSAPDKDSQESSESSSASEMYTEENDSASNTNMDDYLIFNPLLLTVLLTGLSGITDWSVITRSWLLSVLHHEVEVVVGLIWILSFCRIQPCFLVSCL